MIDTTRWVLVEAWLALGLRVDWCGIYDAEGVPKDAWMRDDETGYDYFYGGQGMWRVRRDRSNRTAPGFPAFSAPCLSVATLRHELAHYMVASEDDRWKVNFGITADDPEPEQQTLLAERVIDALCTGSGRIAALALQRTP